MSPAHHLHLLRHAKSSWEDRSLRDHARPLAPRGVSAGQALRRHLLSTPLDVGLVLCSTSTRTRQTWDAVRDAMTGEPELRFVDELYDADVSTLLELVHAVREDIASVLLIGHNPGLGELTALLAGTGEAAASRRVAEKYPTGALATLAVPGPWNSVVAGSCHLAGFVRPRDLPG